MSTLQEKITGIKEQLMNYRADNTSLDNNEVVKKFISNDTGILAGLMQFYCQDDPNAYDQMIDLFGKSVETMGYNFQNRFNSAKESQENIDKLFDLVLKNSEEIKSE